MIDSAELYRGSPVEVTVRTHPRWFMVQESMDYQGAALLQHFLQLQMSSFNHSLESLQKQGNHKHSLDDVKHFEMDAHDMGWAQQAQQIRAMYKSKRVDP